MALAGRNLTRMRRTPSVVTGTVAVPAVYLLGFLVLLRPTMARAGIDYAQYLPPTIVVQSTVFVAIGSALWVADDVASGMLGRLRAMPVARAAPFAGRIAADLVRALLATAVVAGVGAPGGFRFRAGPWAALAFVGVTLLLAAVLSVGFGLVAMTSRNAESAADALQLPYIPLIMISTGFVPAEKFPSWLSGAVAHQPVSVVIDALRALSSGGPTVTVLASALGWLVGLLAVLVAVSARTYRRLGS
jgi:ABC-2 type transport system permease protein